MFLGLSLTISASLLPNTDVRPSGQQLLFCYNSNGHQKRWVSTALVRDAAVDHLADVLVLHCGSHPLLVVDLLAQFSRCGVAAFFNEDVQLKGIRQIPL